MIEQGEVVEVDSAQGVAVAKLSRPLRPGHDDRLATDEAADSVLSAMEVHLAVEALMDSVAVHIQPHQMDVYSPLGTP